jgi:hypothetical protein
LIIQTQNIANASVDRNNSLLAELLYLLVNWSVYGPPCNLSVDQYSVDTPTYYKDWTIKVKAYNYDNLIQSPEVACLINTTQTNSAVYMTPEGDHFTYTEVVRASMPGEDFDWDVECVCVHEI